MTGGAPDPIPVASGSSTVSPPAAPAPAPVASAPAPVAPAAAPVAPSAGPSAPSAALAAPSASSSSSNTSHVKRSLRSSRKLPKSHEVRRSPPIRDESPGPQPMSPGPQPVSPGPQPVSPVPQPVVHSSPRPLPYIPEEKKWASYEELPPGWVCTDDDSGSRSSSPIEFPESDENPDNSDTDECTYYEPSSGDEPPSQDARMTPDLIAPYDEPYADVGATSNLVTTRYGEVWTFDDVAPLPGGSKSAGGDNDADQSSGSTSRTQVRDGKRVLPPTPVAAALKPLSGSRHASSSSSTSSSHTFGPGSVLPPSGVTCPTQRDESSHLQPHAQPPMQVAEPNAVVRDQQPGSLRGSHIQYRVSTGSNVDAVAGW